MVSVPGRPVLGVALVLIAGLAGGCLDDGAPSAKRTTDDGSPLGNGNETTTPPGGTTPPGTTPPPTTPPPGGPPGNQTGGNETGGNGTLPSSDEVVNATVMEGSFPAQATDRVANEIPVAPGAQQIEAYLTWDDGVSGNTPLLSDLDLYLVDPDGTEAVARETSDFEFLRFNDTEALVPGFWSLDVDAFSVPVATDWKLEILIWYAVPTVLEFTGSHSGAVDIFGVALGETAIHNVSIPSGTHAVAARLGWGDSAGAQPFCGRVIRSVADYDLYVVQGEVEMFRSANGLACEFGFVVASEGETLGDGSDWDFEVVPFLVPDGEYTLVVEYV